MITLYELRWSHYCEKVRLALDYMGLKWRSVGIDAFRKSELKQLPLPELLPTPTIPVIHDATTGHWVMDSTPILRYLAETYPNRPALFPGDLAHRAMIQARLLEFDSLLGVAARRCGYTQLILECPEHLAELFLARRAGGLFTRAPFKRWAGNVIGMLLTKRFEFHRAEEIGLYEGLERYLLQLASELEGRHYVVGERPSAADLTLAALLRPLTIVPFFAEHPRLQTLFERHHRVLLEYSREDDFPYQRMIAAARQQRPACRRYLRGCECELPFMPREEFAFNDQQPVWDWNVLLIPYHYWFTLRKNTVRRAEATLQLR